MNTLVLKEIRLVLPAYGLALLLAVAPVWLLTPDPISLPVEFSLLPFWFGAVLLSLSSFGREFGLQTWPLTLAQPLARTRLWWTKIAVLAGGLATVFGAWGLSWAACVHAGLGRTGSQDTLTEGATAVLVAFAGGLWTTLLLRQVIAAFWFTLLVPTAIMAVILTYGGSGWILVAALCFYVVAGFLWAWWYFLRVQEVAWTGGAITLPSWRGAAMAARLSRRVHRPVRALLRKELQLHQAAMLGMGCLFVLHLGIVVLRKIGHNSFAPSTRSLLEVFGGIWFLAPLLVGSMSVAEERSLGTFEGHLALPISRRVQFALKLVCVLVLGGLLSAVLLWTAEGIAGALGVGADRGLYTNLATFKLSFTGSPPTILALIFLMLGLIGCYASTLTRGLIPSLVVAVVSAQVVWALGINASRSWSGFDGRLWRTHLVHYIAWPTLITAFVWLAYRNFRQVSEKWVLWRRNALALMVVLVFIPTFTWTLYHRGWEYLTPLEPAPGPARLVGPRPTSLDASGGSALSVLLPDGRLWVDRIGYDPGRLVLAFGEATGFRVGEKWKSLGGNQLVAGSNWVMAVATFIETVALRSDGTLWVSAKPRQPWKGEGVPPAEEPAGLVRYGNETNWQSVVWPAWEGTWSVTLLKQDGTLWRWGPNANAMRGVQAPRPGVWQGLQACALHRLGADADWAKILAVGDCIYAWKKDGRAWVLRPPDREANQPESLLESNTVSQRCQVFDKLKWRSLAQCSSVQAAVAEDGTMWAWTTKVSAGPHRGERWEARPPVRIGTDVDWVALTGDLETLTALKTDGSLWQLHLGYTYNREPAELTSRTSLRLGTRHDWVAVGSGMEGIISLAVDGSLWHWWRQDHLYYPGYSNQPMLAPSRKPAQIENILTGTMQYRGK